MIKEFNLATPREGFIAVNRQIQAWIDTTSIQEGICTVYCPHTTAGLTINENADPDVAHDLILALNTTFPDDKRFLHGEGNSAAHLKASMVGSSVTVPIKEGKLMLGIWQGIYFCEFDGPRKRTFYSKVIEG